VRWIGVLVCVVACLAACALPGSSQAPTASQVLAARLAAFAAAKTVTMAGHVSYGGVTYPVSLVVEGHGEASGSVEIQGKLVSLRLTGGRMFLQSGEYYGLQNLPTGGQWVLEGSGTVMNLATRLADRNGLAAALRSAPGNDVVQGSSTASGGVRTVKLSTPDVSATVPAAGGPPTRVVTGVDTQLSNGFSDVLLDLSGYGQPANIAAPDTFLDRAQPDSWPAFYQVVITPDTPFSFDGCDPSGCTLSASFKNLGGKVGSAKATFYVSQGGAFVGSCDVPIPPTGNGTMVRAGCRIDYNRNLSASGNVKVSNPQ